MAEQAVSCWRSFSRLEGGGPSDQLTVLIWNAGNIDGHGVLRDGLTEDNLALSFTTSKHHVSLIQEAASERAPAHRRRWGCVPMYDEVCSSDPDNEVGDSS